MSTYYSDNYHVSDELYHHGIKGQRWGIRRYQNEDGSLTPAGIKRYKKYSTLYNEYNHKADIASIKGDKTQEKQFRSISRGVKALYNDKNEDSGITSTALKAGARLGASMAIGVSTTSNILKSVGTVKILSTGFKQPIYAIGSSIVSPVAAPYIMPALLAASAGLTIRDIYKVVKQRNDIKNARTAIKN